MPIGASTSAPFAFIEFCVRYSVRCRPSSELQTISVDDNKLSELTLVQRLVNRSITPRPDPPGTDLSWMENAKVGDCDDYAMTKRGRLLDSGWPASAVLLAIAVVPNGEHHIVVVVVTESGDLVLDNLRPNVIQWTKLPYRWIKRSSPYDPREWQVIAKHPTDKRSDEIAMLERCKSR